MSSSTQPLRNLSLLVEACEEAFAGPGMQSFPDDADVSSPAIGITFGLIRNARVELEEVHVN
jgi:hypothetical protein